MPLAQAENEKDLLLAAELIQKEKATCEELGLQEQMKRFNAIEDLAVNYRGCMLKFGRLPFRNATMGRKNTREEQEFLDENSEV